MYIYVLGALFKDNWEKWLPGAAMGSLYHPERRLPASHSVNDATEYHLNGLATLCELGTSWTIQRVCKLGTSGL